jgi:hypothetical protein
MKKLLCLIMLVVALSITGTALAQKAPTQILPPQEIRSVIVSAPTTFDDKDVYVIVGLFVFAIGAAIFFGIIPSIICGVAAHRKGLSGFGFFIISFIFTPIIGFLAVIAMEPKIPTIQPIDLVDFPDDSEELIVR